jgi:cephalosporin hydroxylase
MRLGPHVRAPIDLCRHTRAAIDGYRYAHQLSPPAYAACRTQRTNRLAEYFDQHVEGRGIWKWRHYFDIYDRHFAKFVGREVHIVEIGIYSGGSLDMWRHYFGDGARIYGVDIEEACRAYEADDVRVFIGDQADPCFWQRFLRQVPRIDIVVDDGGHQAHQQIATVKALLPPMAPGGVFLCEDVHDAHHDFHAFIDGLTRPLNNVPGFLCTAPSALQQHVSSVHRYPLVVVIEKPQLPVADFEAPRRGSEWQPFIDPEDLSRRASRSA